MYIYKHVYYENKIKNIQAHLIKKFEKHNGYQIK